MAKAELSTDRCREHKQTMVTETGFTLDVLSEKPQKERKLTVDTFLDWINMTVWNPPKKT